MRNFKKTTTIFLFTAFFITLFSTHLYATSITPAISNHIMTASDRDLSEIIVENTGNKSITVQPKVVAYSPEDQNLINGDEYLFVRTDIETFTIEPSKKLKLNYEVIPPSNILPGTYFNLIIIEHIEDKMVITQENPVTSTSDPSHLAVLHVTESGAAKEITKDFANINIEVLEKGFPFIKPLKIKYSYQNKTNYVLTPEGEIQIFNSKGKYEPIYTRINTEEEKVYPGKTFEEEITIKKWYLLDLISERKIIGRFYNGIDENFISKEITQEAYPIYAISGVVILVIGIILVKSVREDTKKS